MQESDIMHETTCGCRDAKQSWADIHTSGNTSGIKALFDK